MPKATKWRKVEVRQAGGKLQVRRIDGNPAPLGSGARFRKCVQEVEARGGAYDAHAVCAAAGRKKYGKKKFQAMAKAGAKRAKRKNISIRRSMKQTKKGGFPDRQQIRELRSSTKGIRKRTSREIKSGRFSAKFRKKLARRRREEE